MGITYSFVDGVVYGTDDVNAITSAVVGAGVAPFVAKDSYNVSDLNVMTQALVDAGVQLDGCRCSVSGVGTPEFKIHISKGIVFFETGVKLAVDDEGYQMHAETNVPGYVFAYYSPTLQNAGIGFGEDTGDDEERVYLAYISANGMVTDMRKFAASKIATLGHNVITKVPFERVDEAILHKGKYVVSKACGVDVSRFNYAVVVTTNIYGDSDLKYFPDVGYFTGFFDLKNEKLNFSIIPVGDKKEVRYNDVLFVTATNRYYYVEVVGGELCILCSCKESELDKAIKDAFGCTVCFM